MPLDDRLARAAERGATSEVLALLQASEFLLGPGTPEFAMEANLALIWAAERGHIETLDAVLDLGVDPSIPGSRGHLPLVAACRAGQLEAARHLVERGSDPSKADCHGTPLEQARRFKHQPVVTWLTQLWTENQDIGRRT